MHCSIGAISSSWQPYQALEPCPREQIERTEPTPLYRSEAETFCIMVAPCVVPGFGEDSFPDPTRLQVAAVGLWLPVLSIGHFVFASHQKLRYRGTVLYRRNTQLEQEHQDHATGSGVGSVRNGNPHSSCRSFKCFCLQYVFEYNLRTFLS